MSEIAAILFFTIAAGACIPLGGFVASFERFRSKWLEQELRHFLIALGAAAGCGGRLQRGAVRGYGGAGCLIQPAGRLAKSGVAKNGLFLSV